MVTHKSVVALAVLASASIGSTVASHAESATFFATGMSAGNALNASATITTGPDMVSVSITNNEANPRDVGQNVSDITIMLSGGTSTGVSYNGTQTNTMVTVAAGGAFSEAPTSDEWGLSAPESSEIILNALRDPEAPALTLIGPPGPGGYTNANGSIAGNMPHNPFLFETANFDLNAPGVTPGTAIAGVNFSFGTEGMPVLIGQVPLPPAIYLFASVLGGAFWLGRRKRSAVSGLGSA